MFKKAANCDLCVDMILTGSLPVATLPLLSDIEESFIDVARAFVMVNQPEGSQGYWRISFLLPLC